MFFLIVGWLLFLGFSLLIVAKALVGFWMVAAFGGCKVDKIFFTFLLVCGVVLTGYTIYYTPFHVSFT